MTKSTQVIEGFGALTGCEQTNPSPPALPLEVTMHQKSPLHPRRRAALCSHIFTSHVIIFGLCLPMFTACVPDLKLYLNHAAPCD